MWEDRPEARAKKKLEKKTKRKQSVHSWEPRNRNHTWGTKMTGSGPSKEQTLSWWNEGFSGLKMNW